MLPFVSLLAVVVPFFAPGPSDPAVPAADSSFVWSGKLPAGAKLRIETPRGNIDVTAATGDNAEVSASIRGSSNPRLVIDTRKSGNDVLICAHYEDVDACNADDNDDHYGRHHGERARADFTVKLPKGIRLSASTGNGDATVENAGADVHVGSGNGIVRVSKVAGQVYASSGNGEVSVTGATGAVDASSGNGRVMVTTEAGPVSASTGNGDIDVTMTTLRDKGDMTFTTGNGRVTVTVPPSFSGELDSDTGNGMVRSDFAITTSGTLNKGHLRGVIGSGGRRVHMSSGNGDLELRKGS